MSATRHPESRNIGTREYRGDNGDIRKVRAAGKGIIQRVDVSRPQIHSPALDNGTYRGSHRAQVHRDMRRICDQPPFGIKESTREIQALLNIDRISAVLENSTHLLGNRNEQIAKNFK